MTSQITINLPDECLAKLQAQATAAGIPVEVLLVEKIESWLSQESGFTEASAYVLNKNAELYDRLS